MLTGWKIKSLTKKAYNHYLKRQKDNRSDVEIQKEIKIHKQLIAIYRKKRFSKNYPHASHYIQESLRVAASLNDAESQYQLSKLMFEKGNFWKSLQDSCYKSSIQEKYMEQAFQEAHSFMAAAEDQGHPLAIRQHGLALIHGWGIDVDEEAGFQKIVNSIEKEGTWDKATQIFTELGLNRPEFFASLTALKGGKK